MRGRMAGMIHFLEIAEAVSVVAIIIGFLYWLRYWQRPK
jgi:hypothetical protein